MGQSCLLGKEMITPSHLLLLLRPNEAGGALPKLSHQALELSRSLLNEGVGAGGQGFSLMGFVQGQGLGRVSPPVGGPTPSSLYVCAAVWLLHA